MAINVLYFAWVREAIGMGTERVQPPAHIVTIADLIDWLRGSSEGHGRALADIARLRAAIDQRFVALDTPIGNAHEIAIFPPVTGG
ncbi:MAG: molybdopterin converting factor subunit 1 [Sphingomonas sp.]|nr:molybdopterin converting factor subunit 1 [Sphingomonas sp.]